MTVFIADCQMTLELLDHWRGPWPELVEALRSGPSVLLVAEGSSRLMPGGLAQVLARRHGLHGRLAACGGREAQQLNLARVRLLLASNSGRSREPLAAARAVSQPLALVGVPGGPMTSLGGPTRVLMPRPEASIAATASVYAQVLTVAEAVCVAAGDTAPIARLRAGVAEALAAFPQPVLGVVRIFWCGGEDGLADELALKTAETTGQAGFACPGTMALHGVEELWTDSDLVIDLGLSAEDATDLGTRVSATPARLIRLPALTEDAWAPLDRLVAGWMLLAAQAALLGRDPAVPRRARKVGNPA